MHKIQECDNYNDNSYSKDNRLFNTKIHAALKWDIFTRKNIVLGIQMQIARSMKNKMINHTGSCINIMVIKSSEIDNCYCEIYTLVVLRPTLDTFRQPALKVCRVEAIQPSICCVCLKSCALPEKHSRVEDPWQFAKCFRLVGSRNTSSEVFNEFKWMFTSFSIPCHCLTAEMNATPLSVLCSALSGKRVSTPSVYGHNIGLHMLNALREEQRTT